MSTRKGFHHEHTRPDRDNYIKIDEDLLHRVTPNHAHNYRALPSSIWDVSGHAFELNSVMNYNSQKWMTTQDGKVWTSNKMGLTTTDGLQVQWMYCSTGGFPAKEHVTCKTPDAFGIRHKVFRDRLCDGIRDCSDGSDESGDLESCEVLSGQRHQSPAGCCKVMTLNDKYNTLQCHAEVTLIF